MSARACQNAYNKMALRAGWVVAVCYLTGLLGLY